MIDYEIGDVIEGQFSCSIEKPAPRLRVLVRGRIPAHEDRGRLVRAGFQGDVIDYPGPHKGYGAWGFDSEISFVRPGTPDDEQAANDVRIRVHEDTERMLGRV